MYNKDSRRKILDVFSSADYTKKNVHNVSEKWSIFAILMIFVCWQISWKLYQWHPQEEAISHHISRRVLDTLHHLHNEKVKNKQLNGTIDFLKGEVARIEKSVSPGRKITVENRVVSGSYQDERTTRVFRNIESLMVRLEGENQDFFVVVHEINPPWWIQSAHEMTNFCIMLELLRTMAEEEKLRNSLIFIFSGFQEFLSDEKPHPWKKDLRGMIFLPHFGADGHHNVQFTVHRSQFLVQSYARSAVRPNSQVSLEEIAQLTGLSRDHGFKFISSRLKIPAIAFMPQEDFSQRTKFDVVQSITEDGIHRLTGSILPLLRDLCNLTRFNHQGAGIYFDVLGMILVQISSQFGGCLVIGISIMAIAVPFYSLACSTRDFHVRFIWIEALSTLISVTMAAFVTATVIYAISVNLDASGKPMSWYGNMWLPVGLYSVPSLALLCFIHIRKANPDSTPISLGLRVQSALLGINIAWIFVTLGLFVSGLKLYSIPTILLTLSLIPTIITWLFNLQNSVNLWLYVHLGGQMIVMTWTGFIYHNTIHMLIPRTATLGSANNPDVAIGAICATFTFLTVSYMIPLTLLLPQRKHLVYGLMGTFLVFRLILANSGLEFPYSQSPPKPQRLILMHTLRTFYDETGSRIRYTDSGFWMQELDRNSRKTLESLSAPGMPIPHNDADLCGTDVACGMPFHRDDQLKTGGLWLPASGPLIRDHTHVKLESRKVITPAVHQLDLSLIPKQQMALVIRPKINVTLIQWTFAREIPPMKIFFKDRGHFVRLESGAHLPGEVLNFTLTMKISEGSSQEKLVDILLVAVFANLSSEFTPTFTNMLAKIPPWASASPYLASVKGYTF
ncbi:hypothetical protein DMENIID0001_030540 [Sergentomyia squamirostris]